MITKLINDTFEKIKITKVNKAKLFFKKQKKQLIPELLNILRKTIFIKAKTSVIKEIKIKKIKHEFDNLEYIEEDILTLIINLKSIKLKTIFCKEILIEIKKKGRCFLKGKDFIIKGLCEIINKKKIITKINNNKTFKININIKSKKTNKNNYLKKKKKYKNKIKLKYYRNPINRISIGNKKKKSFLKIETDKTICPIICFIKANKSLFNDISYIKKNIKFKKRIILTYINNSIKKNIKKTLLNKKIKNQLLLDNIKFLIEIIRFKKNKVFISKKKKYKKKLLKEFIKLGFYKIE